MDSKKERILVLFSIFMVIKYVIVCILALQKLAIFEQNVQMMMMAIFIVQGWRVNVQRKHWQIPRYGGFLEYERKRTFWDGDFRKQMRVSQFTFQYLCTLLGPALKKKDIHFKESISVEQKISIILSRLATCNSLQMIGDLFGAGLNMTSITVRDCCEAIKIHLRPLIFKKTKFCLDETNSKGF